MGWLTCKFDAEIEPGHLCLIAGPLPGRGRQKRPYIAKLTGLSEEFGFAREFLESRMTYDYGEFLVASADSLVVGDLIEVRFGNSRDGRNIYKTLFQVLDPLGSGLQNVSRKDAEKLLRMRVVETVPTVSAGRKLRTVRALREHHVRD